MDLIDRQALLTSMCNTCDGWCENTNCDCANCKSDHRCDLVRELSDAPAVDAVEVVRCKDCKLRVPESISVFRHCDLVGMMVDDDDFCSFGKRRDEDG